MTQKLFLKEKTLNRIEKIDIAKMTHWSLESEKLLFCHKRGIRTRCCLIDLEGDAFLPACGDFKYSRSDVVVSNRDWLRNVRVVN